MVTIPYVEGISERITRTFKSFNISSTMKPHCTLRNMLVHPKNKRDPLNTTDSISHATVQYSTSVKLVGSFGKLLAEHFVEAEELSMCFKTRATQNLPNL